VQAFVPTYLVHVIVRDIFCTPRRLVMGPVYIIGCYMDMHISDCMCVCVCVYKMNNYMNGPRNKTMMRTAPVFVRQCYTRRCQVHVHTWETLRISTEE